MLAIVAALSGLGYIFAAKRLGERHTIFYGLGLEGRAGLYPSQFLVAQGKVNSVRYGEPGGLMMENREEAGRITLGIENHEQAQASYRLEVRIRDIKIKFLLDGKILDEIGPIVLSSGEKWEKEIGFMPEPYIADHQNLEFILYKQGNDKPYRNLYFWVDGKGG